MLAFEAIVVTKLKQDNRVNDFEKPVHTGVQSPHLHKKSNMSQIKNIEGEIKIEGEMPLVELIKQNLSKLEEADLQSLRNERDQHIDLSDQMLRYIVLRKADIRGVDFRNSDISEASLDGINAQGVNFEGANMENAFVQGGNLEKAILRRTKIGGADFSKNNRIKDVDSNTLDEADFSRSQADNSVIFENASLKKAKFNNVDLGTFEAGGANLIDAEFNNARISILKLNDAKLNNADMTGLTTKFEHLSLQGADLTGAKMQTFAQHSPLFCKKANTATHYEQIKKEYPGVRWDEPPLLSDCDACEHCCSESEKIAA